jgi:D-methionine transport system substrate-binding protein
VAIADDPVNHGRGLLLERAGLITQREGVGYLGTLDDIIENPKDVQFPKVERPQRVRITSDVDLAQGYPYFIVAAGAFDPASGLINTGPEDLQFNVGFVTRADNPQLQQLVEIFQSSQAVKDQIHLSYAESDDLYNLACASNSHHGQWAASVELSRHDERGDSDEEKPFYRSADHGRAARRRAG